MTGTASAHVAITGYVQERTVDIGRGPHAHVAFAKSTNTIWVLNGGDDTISLLNASTAEPIRTVAVWGQPTHVIIDDKLGQAFVPVRGDRLVVLSLAMSEVIKVVPLPDGTGPSVLVPQQDLGRLYVLGDNGTVNVVRLGDFSVLKTLEVGAHPSWGQPHKKSFGKMHVTNRGSGTVSVIDDTSIEVVATVPVGQGPNRNAVYRERGAMYTADLDSRTLTGVSVTDDSVVGTAPLGIEPFRLVPAEKKTGRPEIWVLGRGDTTSVGGIEVVDATTHTVSHRFETVDRPANWLFEGPIGHVVATHSREMAIVDTRSVSVIGRVSLDRDPDLDCASNMVMNAGGGLFLVNADNTVTLFRPTE